MRINWDGILKYVDRIDSTAAFHWGSLSGWILFQSRRCRIYLLEGSKPLKFRYHFIVIKALKKEEINSFVTGHTM